MKKLGRKFLSILNHRAYRGQITTEYLLLVVVLVVLFQIATKTLKENRYLDDFRDKPKRLFRNMAENGNWEQNRRQSKLKHPNQFNSHRQSKGLGPP